MEVAPSSGNCFMVHGAFVSELLGRQKLLKTCTVGTSRSFEKCGLQLVIQGVCKW